MVFNCLKKNVSWDESTQRTKQESRAEKGLDQIFEESPEAAYLLEQLSTATDHMAILHHMKAAATMEGKWPSKAPSRGAWRLGWIRSAQSGIASFLQAEYGISEAVATDIYWKSAQEWAQGNWVTAHSLLALSTDPMDTVDALAVIFMQTFLFVDERPEGGYGAGPPV